MISKYLSDIGFKEKDAPENWCSGDARQPKWDKERELHGFDSRDTWSLDFTLMMLIYPRLKMYNEVNIVDTDCQTFEIREKTYTFQECIDYILKTFEIHLTDESKINALNSDIFIAWEMFGKIARHLWW